MYYKDDIKIPIQFVDDHLYCSQFPIQTLKSLNMMQNQNPFITWKYFRI